MKSILLLIILYASPSVSVSQSSDKKVGGSCEDCELMYEGMPDKISSSTIMAASTEPGERMIITGTIYKKDGISPAPNVILYLYHTDYKGNYTPTPNQIHGKRHGHIRAWIKTGSDGKYQFTTIRPASYPNSTIPQHIHPIVKEQGLSLYWIDEFLFDDDPHLTENERKRQEKRGGSGIIKLQKNKDGMWIGTRDIILGKNVPGY
jgi:protocatechuate 3,4-dioxygenase, beta subunit